jgi:serine/threonine-protein phosphatase CPPED1
MIFLKFLSMKIKSNYLLIILILSLSGNSVAQSIPDETSFFFIQMTDPQFGMHEENKGFDKETELYMKAVEEINRLKPDFVVITGDLVHDPDDESQIGQFKNLTGKIDPGIPVYMIPGNHDVGLVPDKESLKKYERNYGDDKFAFSHKGSLFIGMNTSLIKADLEKPEKRQFKWLKKQLKKGNSSSHILVFGHYPFFIKSFDETENYSNIQLNHRVKYLSLFKEHEVDAIFSGHLHNNAQAEYEGIQLTATSAVGKPLGKAPSGFRIIKVTDNHIEHAFYGLGEIPETVVFD